MALKMIAVFDINIVLVLTIVIQNLAALNQLTVPLVDVRSYSNCPVVEQHKIFYSRFEAVSLIPYTNS